MNLAQIIALLSKIIDFYIIFLYKNILRLSVSVNVFFLTPLEIVLFLLDFLDD